MHTGTLYIIAAPSGAGKTSLVKALLESLENIKASVSYTTRPPRPGEINGTHYNFVEPAEFHSMSHAGVFLEQAQVFDNFYGTSRLWVEKELHRGQDVILEIDWQGAQQIRLQRADTLSIFILPPSIAALQQRLQGRGQDQPAVIARRMQDAQSEMQHYMEFDYLVINADFNAALEDLQAIIRARRLCLPIQAQKYAEQLEQMLVLGS